jgi:alpha-D-xyloside xylohydrolase
VINFGPLDIHLLSPTIIRVTVKADDNVSLMKPLPHSVSERQWDRVNFEIEDTNPDEKTILIENGCSITVDLLLLRLTFRDPSSGKIILEEDGRKFLPVVDDIHGNTYSPQQGFKSPSNELFFGGGTLQQGFTELRGEPLFLRQRNTESAVPFFLSNNGYGLFWDNAGDTWLNPLDIGGEQLSIGRGHQGINKVKVPFTPHSRGRHYFTLHCPSVVYGDSILATAELSVQRISGASNPTKIISWYNKNKPPTLSGRVSDLEPNVEYEISLECEHCCRSFHQEFDRDDVQLYVTRPSNHTSDEKTVLRASLGDFVDYYVLLPFKKAPSDSLFDGIVRSFRSLTGGAPLLPKWTYGFWHSKEHYANQSELLDAAEGFRSRGIPVDGIVQDWKYWGELSWSPQWDPLIYPQPKSLASRLHEMHYHFMVSVWCKFENVTDFLIPLKREGQLLKATNWLDIFQPAAQESLFAMADTAMYSQGVDALWLDATEPEGLVNFGKTVYPEGKDSSGSSANAQLNTYSLAVTEGITQRFATAYPHSRPFHLTRSFAPGQQRTSGVLWSGDISGNWDMLRRQVTCSIGFGLSGSPYWSQDTGGFFRPDDQYSSPDYKELLVRWFHFAIFVPITRYHGQGGELWLYGDAVTDIVTETLFLRYRLLPTVYSLAHYVSRDSYTMQRHFAFDFLDQAAAKVDDSFMFGPALLVAPVVHPGQSSRKVYLPVLPQGLKWFNFWTGESQEGGEEVEVAAPLAQPGPPLMGKGGELLLLGPRLQWVDGKATDPLEVRVYGGGDASFELYEDGGLDNTYRTHGAYSIIHLRWQHEIRTFSVSEREGAGYPGMLLTRKLLIVLVRPDHGVGLDVTQPEEADAVIEYSGMPISMRIK